MATFRYPLKTPVAGDYLSSSDAPTGRIDYLKIRRYRPEYGKESGGYAGGDNYNAATLPNNDVKKIYAEDTVYIAMPQALSVAYQTDYAAINMGAVGVLGAQISSAVAGDGDAASVTAAIQNAARAGMPEFAYNKAASITQNVAGALGMETGVTGNAIQALTKGRIVNPFTEQIFNGVQFRNHQFSFKMFARNKSEAQQILKIIAYLKLGALPMLGDADSAELDKLMNSTAGSEATTAANKAAGQSESQSSSVTAETANLAGKFLKVPDRFELEFVRYDPATERISKVTHFRFKPCVATNISVNYTPDGQYVSFKDGIADLTDNSEGGPAQLLVPAVELGIAFAETVFVTAGDIPGGF